MSDIAVAHKDYDVRGGGEIVVEELADEFDAPLYVGRRDGRKECDGGTIEGIVEDNRIAQWLIDRGGIPRSLAYMVAWQQDAGQLHDHETVILSGNEPLWWVPRDQQTVIAYTHSPPRWQYDLWHTWDKNLGGRLGQLYGWAVRVLYESNVRRPDLFVANSDLVARRIERYWNVPEDQIRVCYPPVDVDSHDPAHAGTGDHYVVVSRLAGHKHLDEIVEAANQTGVSLKVAGKGPERDRLEAMAGETVEFVGYVSEERKRELLASAKAFLNAAANEDFCMSTIEAMASGTPVITVADGFPEFQVLDGENGIIVPRGELARGIERFERKGVAWSERRIERFADRFAAERFREEMRRIVAEAEERAAVSVPWSDAGQPEPAVEHVATDGGGQQ